MIFPKKIDVNKHKAAERKVMIDEGVILAKRVDELRGMRLQMEKNFEEWRIGTSKEVQKEIDALIEEKESLIIDINHLKQTQQKLLDNKK